MFAPWRASARAMPRPMPLVEPVTRAVLPLSMGFSPLRDNLRSSSRTSERNRFRDERASMTLPTLNYVSCPDPSGSHRMAYWLWGAPDAAHVVVCVHGLSRQGRDFDTLARGLLARSTAPLRIVCPDVVGRGGSDWLADPRGYGIPQYAGDMLQ